MSKSPFPQANEDQASELRRLVAMRSRRSSGTACEPAQSCRSLVMFSGKGGVGKSVLSVNLASALVAQGASVCLIDAAPHMGNLGLLCGQNGYWNLGHVVAGTRCLDDVLLTGPGGIRIVPGANCLLDPLPKKASIFAALTDLERQYDWLIFDTGTDVVSGGQHLIEVADCALNIVTPEPTALAQAYGCLKGLSSSGTSHVSLLVNETGSEQQAMEILNRLRQAVRTFLRTDAGLAGFVPADEAVRRAVNEQLPLSLIAPQSPAHQALLKVAERLKRTVTVRRQQSFFERLKGALEVRG